MRASSKRNLTAQVGSVDAFMGLQAIIGHKSEQMWNRYNKIEEEDLTRAAHKLNTLITLTPPSHQTHTLQSI
jgi:hypothetical protein